MCQLNAYIIKDGSRQCVMEDIDSGKADGTVLKFYDIFGSEKIINGTIRSFSISENSLIIEPSP